MPQADNQPPAAQVIDRAGLDRLIAALDRAGYTVVGPVARDGAIVYEPVARADQLPDGWIDEQDGGRYRLRRDVGAGMFSHTVGPHSWKRYLYPAEQRLWRARRKGRGFEILRGEAEAPAYAFLGVRACEIAAIEVQDRVFDNGDFADPAYLAKRAKAFIVAVNCTRAGGTCFCASMGTGPRAEAGFDLALTELKTPRRHRFLVEAGSERGAAIAAGLVGEAARPADRRAARDGVAKAAGDMGRRMTDGVEALLKRNLEHPRWDDVAARCLACANCTLVCPTCFCADVDDTTDLAGEHAERWRRWGSCFTANFSYVHGGPVRRDTRSRYRQWITHKLSTWHDQFGSSGCVGCGRCITWCPVGIDITEEARAIADSEGAGRVPEGGAGGGD
jgi:ferredoxin